MSVHHILTPVQHSLMQDTMERGYLTLRKSGAGLLDDRHCIFLDPTHPRSNHDRLVVQGRDALLELCSIRPPPTQTVSRN